MLVSERTSRKAFSILQLAEITQLSVRTLRRKKEQLAEYHVERVGTNGRPIDLYSADAIPAIVGWESNEKEQLSTSTPRADKGKPRGKNMELLDQLTTMAFAEFMSSAQPDVRGASRRAVKRMKQLMKNGTYDYPVEDLEKITSKEWFYRKWLVRKDKYNVGVAHKDNWEIKHKLEYKQWTAATTTIHTRYRIWQILESNYGCGKGSGFAKAIFLDDRQTDVYIDTPDGPKMMYAVYVWDLLTGCLLWVEPAENVNAQTYIRAILATIVVHGFYSPIFFMENSRAAMATRVQRLIEGLYTDEQVQYYCENKEHLRMFNGELVVHRNVPHLPRDFGKGAGERFFGEIKKLDAINYPRAFQGGNRAEAVELQRAKKLIPAKQDMPSEYTYYRGLLAASYDLYLDQDRDSLKYWANEKGLEPTRRAMMKYYMPAKKQLPHKMGFLKAMYFANPQVPVATVRNIGYIRCQIQGRELNLVSDKLFQSSLLGTKVAIVESPFDKREFGLFTVGKDPKPIGLAKDQTATNLTEAIECREENRRIREHVFAKEREETARKINALPPELRPEGLIAERQANIALPQVPNEEEAFETPEFVDAIVVDSDDELQANEVETIEVSTAAEEDNEDEDITTSYNQLMGIDYDDEETDADDMYEQFFED